MKIKELIKILQSAPDQERDVYLKSVKNDFTTLLDYSFDDNNHIRLYEIVEQ